MKGHMKLSNKILLAFFGFLFLYLTAAFTEIRLTGTPNMVNENNSKAEVVDLPGIHYIVVNDLGRNVTIVQSDRFKVEVRSISGNLLKDLKYEITGDTLKLLSFKPEDDEAYKVTVLVPKDGLKGIGVKATLAIVSGLEQAQLHLTQNDARIWMSNSKISNMEMSLANGSYINISQTEIDSLSVRANGSEATINSQVGLVEGSLTNGSFLRLSGFHEIQIRKDESSNLNMY